MEKAKYDVYVKVRGSNSEDKYVEVLSFVNFMDIANTEYFDYITRVVKKIGDFSEEVKISDFVWGRF